MAQLKWILVALFHIIKQNDSAFPCLNNVDRRFECCHPCNKMDNKNRCTSLCPKDFFIIKRTTDLKCSQKGSIIIFEGFEDFDMDDRMQPLCVRQCPERYQNTSKTECQYCDESCNVTVAMEHFDKVNGISIGLSSLALVLCLVITFIILYCAFKRRRIKRRQANPRNNNTFDFATTRVTQGDEEIGNNEAYAHHNSVTNETYTAKMVVSNTSNTLNKDFSTENANVSLDVHENKQLKNKSCEKLCVAELTSKCYGLQHRKDFVSTRENITALEIEKSTFVNSERVVIHNIDTCNFIVKGNPTINVGHVIGLSVSDKNETIIQYNDAGNV
ncbi:uncharacterized protein LOC134694549 [Mytilus trossulus]|uniref:uncharacterized protein LOC134694549 n=1 Tax=Mytilus trossulus TaxID=6551 RepID=UPI003003F2A7